MTQVIRNHKDTVFCMLYKNPKNALELYNGLCGKYYTDETQLRYNTLENAVYMNIKNDVSFLIHDYTVLYEQQAAWNPNMPLRSLYYIADIFHIIGNEVPYDMKSSARLRTRTNRIMSQATVLGAAKCAPLDGNVYSR